MNGCVSLLAYDTLQPQDAVEVPDGHLLHSDATSVIDHFNLVSTTFKRYQKKKSKAPVVNWGFSVDVRPQPCPCFLTALESKKRAEALLSTDLLPDLAIRLFQVSLHSHVSSSKMPYHSARHVGLLHVLVRSSDTIREWAEWIGDDLVPERVQGFVSSQPHPHEIFLRPVLGTIRLEDAVSYLFYRLGQKVSHLKILHTYFVPRRLDDFPLKVDSKPSHDYAYRVYQLASVCKDAERARKALDWCAKGGTADPRIDIHRRALELAIRDRTMGINLLVETLTLFHDLSPIVK
jgi:hypothetical protein